MASTNNYINEYETLDEMNAAYESDHSGSWVAYCAEDNNLYYQQKTSISSKYFDNLEYNSTDKTLDFYIDGEIKKSIDVSPWWFEKDSYYTREESDAKYVNGIGTNGNNLTYTINNSTSSLTIPYSTSANTTPWSGITDTPTTVQGYGITNNWLGSEGNVVDQFYGTRYYKVIEFDYYTTDYGSYFGSMVFEVIGDEMCLSLWQEIHIAIRSSVPVGNVLYKSLDYQNTWYITLDDGHASIYVSLYDNNTWKSAGSIKMFELNNFYNVQYHSKVYIETEPSGSTYTYKIPKLIPTYQTVS